MQLLASETDNGKLGHFLRSVDYLIVFSEQSMQGLGENIQKRLVYPLPKQHPSSTVCATVRVRRAGDFLKQNSRKFDFAGGVGRKDVKGR